MSSATECCHAITVKVFVPSSTRPRPFTWAATKTVGEAAKDVAEAWCLETEAPTFQNHCDEVLDRDKSLKDAGVSEGDQLELVSAGGGV